MKKTKTEMKQEVKKLFELASRPEEIVLAIERMHEYKISTDNLIDNEYFVTRQVIRTCATDPEMTRLLNNPPAPKKTEQNIDSDGEDLDAIWQKTNTKEKTVYALGFLSDLYIRGKLYTDKTASYRVFEITDAQNRVCRELKGDASDIEDEVCCKLAEKLTSEGLSSSPNVQNQMYWYWERFCDKIGKTVTDTGSPDGVVTCNSPLVDADRWSLFRSPYAPDKTVPFPKLKSTIDRMSEGRAFAAWIWGVYTGVYKGRQVFWIYGPDGEEGKSYLSKFLGQELFGENLGYKTIDGTQIKNGSRFLNSSFSGSKFIVYPDCNRVHLMELEIIKTLSSGGRDSSVSEEKFKAAQTVTIDARVLVCSNFLPEVKRDNWYQSRLALCKIDKLKEAKDPNIDKVYKKELPGFLAFAKECYEELCKDNEQIKLKVETQAWMSKLVDLQEPLKKDIFDRHFSLDASATTSMKRIFDVLEIQENVKDKGSKEEWISYLDNLPCVSRERRSAGNVYLGIREKASGSASTEPTVSTTGWKPFGK